MSFAAPRVRAGHVVQTMHSEIASRTADGTAVLEAIRLMEVREASPRWILPRCFLTSASLELLIVLLPSGLEVLQSYLSYARNLVVMRQLRDYVQWGIGITGNCAYNVTVRVC